MRHAAGLQSRIFEKELFYISKTKTRLSYNTSMSLIEKCYTPLTLEESTFINSITKFEVILNSKY